MEEYAWCSGLHEDFDWSLKRVARVRTSVNLNENTVQMAFVFIESDAHCRRNIDLPQEVVGHLSVFLGEKEKSELIPCA